MNTLEPDSNVGDEGNAGSELRADLPLVNVISQAVRDNVVREELDVVLGAWLGTSSRVSRDTERSGLSTEERNQRGDSNLGCSRVAARVGNASSLGDIGTCDQLGKSVSPLGVEAVIGAEINNDVALLRTLVHGIDERLANAVRQRHDPAVNVTVGRHALDIVGTQVLIGDLTLVITLQLLARQLARRNVAQVQVRVGVDQADQSLAGVTAGSNKSNLGRLAVGHVLLAQGGVGVRRRVGANGSYGHGRTSGARSPQSVTSRESTSLFSRGTAGAESLANVGGRLGRPEQSRFEVDVTEHLATILVELLDQLLNFVTALDAVPEKNLALAAEATVGLVKEPGQVLIVLLNRPHQLGEILLDGRKHVVGHVSQPSRLGDGEGGQVRQGGDGILLGRQDHGQSLHGLIVVDLEVTLLQAFDVAVDGSSGIQTLAVTHENILQLLQVLELGKRSLNVHLVASADQRTGTGVGEEFLLQVGGVDDRNAGGTREITEEILHLLDLQASTVADPPLTHQMLILLVEVDRGNLLAGVTVEEPTLLGKVDDLEGLQRAGQLTSRHIGVDVEDLAIGGLGHGSQDRETASLDRGLNWRLVHAIDLTDKVVSLLVEIVGREDTGGKRAGAHTHALQFLDQLQVLLQKQLAGKSQSLAVGHPDTILELWLHAGLLQHAIELGASTVDDDGVETDMVEEGERGRQRVKVFGDNGTANLDDGELLGGDGGEVREVLLDLTLGADVTQQLDDGRPGRGELGVRGTGVVATLQQRHSRGLEGLTSRGESRRRNGVRCGERSEGLAGGSSPHSGTKGEHLASQHAAAFAATRTGSLEEGREREGRERGVSGESKKGKARGMSRRSKEGPE